MASVKKATTAKEAAAPLRYWDIANLLRRDIEKGRYKLGDRLPTEEQLLVAFDASRHSVREALRVLTEEGLLLRRPRAGSTVIARTAERHFTQRMASVQELLNYPNTTRKTLWSGYVQASHELAAILKCPVGANWFCLRSLRIPVGSAMPFCQTDIYIAPQFAGVTRHKKHLLIPVVDQIAELYGVQADSTDIEFSAGIMPKEVAQLLHVPLNSATLNVVRRYAGSDGKVFEVTISMHAAQRYTYNFHLKREQPVRAKRAGKSAG
jgi:DNA-binding GntR family transcriptional regulator